jgi:hypothetical protein
MMARCAWKRTRTYTVADAGPWAPRLRPKRKRWSIGTSEASEVRDVRCGPVDVRMSLSGRFSYGPERLRGKAQSGEPSASVARRALRAPQGVARGGGQPERQAVSPVRDGR